MTIPAFPVRRLSASDPDYPARLNDLAQARPDPLYVRGAASWPDGPIAAVVGARAMTRYARGVTRRVVGALVLAGVGVVSGMARGVDRVAHEATLSRGGFTAAVLGTGVDRVYPREHTGLYTALLERGLLLSEFAPGTDVRPWQFPARNRILAALADVLVLVQADQGSGCRHTVRAALRLKRPVFVAPWPLDHPAYTGNAAWIAGGVPGVRMLTDVAEAARAAADAHAARRGPASTPLERVAHVVTVRGLGIDAIAHEADLAIGETAAALVQLEIAGRIERLGGDRYRRRER